MVRKTSRNEGVMNQEYKKDEKYRELAEENKKLREKLKATEEKYQKIKKERVNNSVIERWKIGKYLHDNLAQQLTSAQISLSLLKSKSSEENLVQSFDEILDILEESIQEVRDLSHDIIPMNVNTEGVGQAFTYLKKQAERQHGVNCELETGDILNKINSRQVATNLYHIAQEAIKNAVIHGEASNIKIALYEDHQQLNLQIKDDGKGFDSTDNENGMGIIIMKHRAKELDGRVGIKDANDGNYSTCVSCILPLKSQSG